jgi:sec-independent protein translocase protein TatB
MFDIGFSEILLITGLSLVVLGPDKLPRVARRLGRWAGRARAMARQFRDQLDAEAEQLRAQTEFHTGPEPRQPPPQPQGPPAPAAPPPDAPAPGAPTPPATPPASSTTSDAPPPHDLGR